MSKRVCVSVVREQVCAWERVSERAEQYLAQYDKPIDNNKVRCVRVCVCCVRVCVCVRERELCVSGGEITRKPVCMNGQPLNPKPSTLNPIDNNKVGVCVGVVCE